MVPINLLYTLLPKNASATANPLFRMSPTDKDRLNDLCAWRLTGYDEFGQRPLNANDGWASSTRHKKNHRMATALIHLMEISRKTLRHLWEFSSPWSDYIRVYRVWYVHENHRLADTTVEMFAREAGTDWVNISVSIVGRCHEHDWDKQPFSGCIKTESSWVARGTFDDFLPRRRIIPCWKRVDGARHQMTLNEDCLMAIFPGAGM
ncbi:hypothetical protein MCOR02_003896 [Pyricularia oryzae]|nr:hypothetical protein MCOR01_005717 [Pyricularia oryzae]KAH9434930.1 hypothetical protein MCOR02_003896 [Pyricularia oryzae]KAI6260986.1 hypothetical protein MCOR19_002749 [Pyricularia oryzae]KAI6280701.1 hypothetical protein MCOR26_003620 [Pyricularia oryzae]KAI6408752.1 hypothetical protein MCOR20_005281 [Pyricularia oryzae]